MNGLTWFILGIFPAGFCLWHPQGRRLTVKALVWMLNKFHEIMSKTDGKKPQKDEDET